MTGSIFINEEMTSDNSEGNLRHKAPKEVIDKIYTKKCNISGIINTD